jgi:hypothetical protein
VPFSRRASSSNRDHGPVSSTRNPVAHQRPIFEKTVVVRMKSTPSNQRYSTDNHFRSRYGHEPLERGRAVCVMAGTVARQPISGKVPKSGTRQDVNRSAKVCGLPHGASSEAKALPGSEPPQITIQARCSQSDYSYGTQVGRD